MTEDGPALESNPPSDWVLRFAPEVPKEGQVLDLACGTGRHTQLFLKLGHPVPQGGRVFCALVPCW